MATKPTKPTGDFAYRDNVYSSGAEYSTMSATEFALGRNNTGENETPLGSVPNALKDNWLFRYFNEQIKYLNSMVDYLDTK